MEQFNNIQELNAAIAEDSRIVSLIKEGMKQSIIGQEQLVKSLLIGLLADGHILLEGVPGLAKTLAIKTLSQLIKADYSRIQFTPDLLPYDITGVDIWDKATREFVFRPGPVFANVVLADEINRTTPKVQSALLEAMAESQVTVGTTTRSLANPFLVIATQNPVESEGTYVLPEAQKDRFMLCLRPGYPGREDEYAIVRDNLGGRNLPELEPVMDVTTLVEIKQEAAKVHVDDRLIRCAVDLAAAIRNHADVLLGVSTRGALMFVALLRAYAYIHGRDYVIDQDLADLAAREIRRIRHD